MKIRRRKDTTLYHLDWTYMLAQTLESSRFDTFARLQEADWDATANRVNWIRSAGAGGL